MLTILLRFYFQKQVAPLHQDLDQRRDEHVAARQGITLVHFSAQREHFLCHTFGAFNRYTGQNSSQNLTQNGSLTKTA
jgi:hypothetical protein